MTRHAVIDTNVALDLLVFRDPRCTALSAALQSRQLRWRATAAMRAELARVATPELCSTWTTSCERTLSEFDRLAELEDPACIDVSTSLARCSDPDDQIFIDFAVATRATWLFSRDRAVLKLARILALRASVRVVTPEGFAQAAAAQKSRPDGSAPVAAEK